jgi:hypothetical protein
MNDLNESSKELFAIVKELSDRELSDWLQNSLFTWQWWAGVTITIAFWIFWIYFRDKKSTSRLLFVGFFAIVFAFIVDTVGISFNLWFFEYKIIPVIQMFLPWDFSLIPVSIMVLLQIKPNKYLFTKALFFATFSAFIAEPIFHWIKFYYLTNWRYTYSFILYLILYLTCDFLSKRKTFDPL